MQTLAQPRARSAAARPASRPAAGTRWAPAALALLLAACVHSPQAAVTAPAPPLAADAARGSAAGCRETPSARAALQAVTHELQAQGLAFRAACHAAAAGWVVQVRVVDGMKASKVVRGPLADGHDVDMGTPAGEELAGAAPHAQGFSPDVQYNREWLRGLMARHQFDAQPDAWWHFTPRGQAPADDTDLAAR